MVLAVPVRAGPAGEAPVRVEGRVRELGSGDAVPGAAVLGDAPVPLATADEAGRFHCEAPAGAVLAVRYPGYAPGAITLTATPGGAQRATVWLSPTQARMEPIVVSGRAERNAPGETRVRRAQIERLPGTFGDPLRTITIMPGVMTRGDYLAQPAVRGSGPFDNQYFLDGIPWPVPYHFFGIVSTAGTNLLDAVDFYPGGFGPAWGNAHGAILDARTRAGRADRVGAFADVNLVMSDALVEGPLGGGASFTLSGRRTYYDLLLGPYLADQFTAFPRFWDSGATLTWPVSPSDRIEAVGLASDDLLGVLIKPDQQTDPNFRGEFRERQRFSTGGFRWAHTAPGGFTASVAPYAFTQTFEIGLGHAFGFQVYPRTYGVRAETALPLGHALGADHELGLGGSAEQVRYKIRISVLELPNGDTIYFDAGHEEVSSRLEQYSGWAEERLKPGGGWLLRAGARWDQGSRTTIRSLEPRLGFRWDAAPRTAFTGAWGWYARNPSPQQQDPVWGNPALGPERSRHLVAGVEQGLPDDWSVRLDGWDKDLRRLITRADGDSFSREGLLLNQGRGRGRGLELLARRDTASRGFLWLAYSLARADRQDVPGEPWHRFEYDQTHGVTLAGSLPLGPRWTFGAKFQAHSGPLVTPVVGRVLAWDGIWNPVYGDPYSLRLAPYARLDLRVEKAWLNRGWTLKLYLETMNTLNRRNPIDLEYTEDYTASHTVNNLPFIPYLGLTAQF